MSKRIFDDAPDEFTQDQPAQKKKRMSRFEGDAANDPVGNGIPSSQNIQELLASTKKQIEERKKQTQAFLSQQKPPPTGGLLPTPSAPPPVNKFTAAEHVMSAAMSEAVEKARKAAELQARINSSLLSKPGLLSSIGKVAPPPSLPSKPMPLILDEEGRTVDSSGRTVQLSIKHSTAQVNIRAQQRAKFRQITEKKPTTKEESEEQTAFFDPRVTLTGAQRSKRQFKFNEAGKFVKQGQMLRAKAQLEQLQTEIASVARKTGISSATKLALIAPSKDLFDDSIPVVEWWDAAILTQKQDAFGDKYRDISNLIEHPVPVQPPGEPAKSVALPIILTSKERKKLRKQRRREAEKEKQEKIQFGLIEKPEPKVRISNLMRVLGSEAVQDPTKIEAYVRSQMAERQRKHEEANAARKLTPEQRKAKKLKKLKEDLSCGVHVTVYRVHDLSNQAIKFKVDMNAQQYHLTGCVLLFHNVNLVVVEGGPKCLKKFKRLMMHRIKWNPRDKRADDDDDDSDTETTQRKQNACYVVWEGKVHDRAFNDWKVRHFSTEGLARDHLKRHGVEHYWDLALSETIVEQEDDN